MSADEKGRGQGNGEQAYRLYVNRDEKTWEARYITGEEILELAQSPDNWVVNQIVPGPGEDPEIGKQQEVDLDMQSEPEGIKRFKTRKPDTSPGQ